MEKRKPEKPSDILMRIDWTYDGERYPEATTLKHLPMMLASIDSQGGEVVRIEVLEPLDRN